MLKAAVGKLIPDLSVCLYKIRDQLFCKNMVIWGWRDSSVWLRALVALAEDLGLFLSTHM